MLPKMIYNSIDASCIITDLKSPQIDPIPGVIALFAEDLDATRYARASRDTHTAVARGGTPESSGSCLAALMIDRNPLGLLRQILPSALRPFNVFSNFGRDFHVFKTGYENHRVILAHVLSAKIILCLFS